MLIYLNVTCLTVFFFIKQWCDLQMHTNINYLRCNGHATKSNSQRNYACEILFTKIMIALIHIAKINWYILLKGKHVIEKALALKITLKFGKSFHLKSISVLNRFWTSLKQWDACTNMQLVRPRNTPDCGSNIAKIILFLSFSLS